MPPLQTIDQNTGLSSRPVDFQRPANSEELVFEASSSSSSVSSSSQNASLQPTGRYSFGHSPVVTSREEDVVLARSQISREDQDMSEFETHGIHGARWERQAHCRRPPAFTGSRGLNDRRGRSKRGDGKRMRAPIDYWRMFVTDEILDDIVKATKVRVITRMVHRPTDFYAARFDKENWPTRNDRKSEKSPITKKDLEQFIGVIYGLGITYKRGMESAFSNNDKLGVGWIKDVMSLSKFQRIKTCISTEDLWSNRTTSGNIPSNLHVPKIGALLEKFRHRCKSVYQPGQNLAYDEQVAKTDSRYTPLRQILRHKKYNGIQVWSLCESGTGYLVNFVVRIPRSTWGIDDAMHALLTEVQGKWHNVYCDNLFTSLSMLRWSKERQINLAGTARTNRGFPKQLSRRSSVQLGRGEWDWVMTRDGICAVAWRDSQVAQFMSNWHDPREESCGLRRESGYSGRRLISAPKLASDYNAYMGGVDQLDSLRGSCTCALKSKKWWHSLLWWMLDSSMVNAYQVYKFEEEQARRRPLARVDFIFACVNELIKDEHLPANESRMSTGQRKRARPEAGTECPTLHPGSLDGDRTNCKNCWNRNGLRQTTKWRCSTCNAPLCVECMYEWHHERLDDQ